MKYQPIPLTVAEQARIEADALAGAFDDHRAVMDPTNRGHLRREKNLHSAARLAELRARRLEADAAEGVVR